LILLVVFEVSLPEDFGGLLRNFKTVIIEEDFGLQKRILEVLLPFLAEFQGFFVDAPNIGRLPAGGESPLDFQKDMNQDEFLPLSQTHNRIMPKLEKKVKCFLFEEGRVRVAFQGIAEKCRKPVLSPGLTSSQIKTTV